MESGDCDDAFGDLGLGRGLQPGAVWRRDCRSDPEWKTLVSADVYSTSAIGASSTTDMCMCCRRRSQSNNSSSNNNKSSNSYCHRKGSKSEGIDALKSSLFGPQVCQAAAEVGQETLQEDGRGRNETDRALHSSELKNCIWGALFYLSRYTSVLWFLHTGKILHWITQNPVILA